MHRIDAQDKTQKWQWTRPTPRLVAQFDQHTLGERCDLRI
jgi:hypothetical protein